MPSVLLLYADPAVRRVLAANRPGRMTFASDDVTDADREVYDECVVLPPVWDVEATVRALEPLRADRVFFHTEFGLPPGCLLASRWVGPSGAVYALEPVGATHERLRRNLDLNPTANVTAVQVGASSAPGRAAIALEADAGHSHLVAGEVNPGRQETITLTTIDAFVDSKGLTRVDVLKIDVEGADFEVIRGAQATLRRFRPVVLMEVELIARFGASVGDVERFLDAIGYDCQLLRHRSATDLLCRPRRLTAER